MGVPRDGRGVPDASPGEATRTSPLEFRSVDGAFVRLVDGAFADAAARSGAQLLCRPGCAQCCSGVFPVGPADSLRLLDGLHTLRTTDHERAARVEQRAREAWRRLEVAFPGDSASGLLDPERAAEFEDYGDDEVCPALDPGARTCDLYHARPHTCRVFGPPVKTGEGYGVCELCFTQATADEVVAAALAPEAVEPSPTLDAQAMAIGAQAGETVIPYLLAHPPAAFPE